MSDFFELLGKVIAAVGGAGVILVAVSGFLSKLWAQLFMERQKRKYKEEIEEYKSKLQYELEKAQQFNERATYKDKALFDTEFQIYKEIIPCIIKAEEEYSKTYDNLQICLIEKTIFKYESIRNFRSIEHKLDKLFTEYSTFIDEKIANEIDIFINYISQANVYFRDALEKQQNYDIGLFKECNIEIHTRKIKIITDVRSYFRGIIDISKSH